MGFGRAKHPSHPGLRQVDHDMTVALAVCLDGFLETKGSRQGACTRDFGAHGRFLARCAPERILRNLLGRMVVRRESAWSVVARARRDNLGAQRYRREGIPLIARAHFAAGSAASSLAYVGISWTAVT